MFGPPTGNEVMGLGVGDKGLRRSVFKGKDGDRDGCSDALL